MFVDCVALDFRASVFLVRDVFLALQTERTETIYPSIFLEFARQVSKMISARGQVLARFPFENIRVSVTLKKLRPKILIVSVEMKTSLVVNLKK